MSPDVTSFPILRLGLAVGIVGYEVLRLLGFGRHLGGTKTNHPVVTVVTVHPCEAKTWASTKSAKRLTQKLVSTGHKMERFCWEAD